MNTNLSVIGLDRTGISIALSLAKHGGFASISGWDADPMKMEAAKEMKAFSSLVGKLEDAVKFADLLLLTLPLDEIRETFRLLKKWIKKDAVIFYFSWMPATAALCAKEEFPPFVHFAALTPSINPKYLDDPEDTSPHADLFENSRMFISHNAEIPSGVIQIATELAGMLGAEPYFADLEEVNGLQTIVQLLPYISNASLIDEIINEPGWKDASLLAGVDFAGAIRWLNLLTPENITAILVNNRENSQRVIASLQDSLTDLASLIKGGNEQELLEKFSQLQVEGKNWLIKRKNVQPQKGSAANRK
jgi:prephenate dehydrogenase